MAHRASLEALVRRFILCEQKIECQLIGDFVTAALVDHLSRVPQMLRPILQQRR
jgi:hypothetical protein